MSPTTATVMEAIDQHQAVEKVVDEFYDRVLADEALRGLFDSVAMNGPRRHQTNFLTMALCGTNGLTGGSAKQGRQRPPITNDHFDRVARHLSESITGAGVGPEDLRRILAIVGPLKSNRVTDWPYDRSL